MSIISKQTERLQTMFRAIGRNYKAAPIIFVSLMIVNLAASGLSYIPGLISRSLLNLLQSGASYKWVVYTILLAVPAAIIIKVVDVASSMLSLRQNDAFEQYINNEILEKNAKLDVSCYDTPKYYNIIRDLSRSKRSFNRLNTQAMRFLAATLTFVINIAVITYYSSFIYVIMMLIFVIPAVLLSSRYESKMNKYEIDNQCAMRRLSYYAGVMTDRVSAQEIRFYDLGDFFIRKYEELSNEYRDGIKKINLKYGIINSLAKVLPWTSVCIVLIVSAVNVVYGRMLIGDFVFLISAVSGLQTHFMQIVFNLSMSDVNCHATKKYENYLVLPEADNSGSRLLEKLYSIEFRNVSFSYPYSDDIVLDKASFRIDPREKTALVGVNGAGKTTIAKLLTRFYQVSSGEILINGVDINEYELNSLRAQIAPMFQNYNIYSLSLGFNLTLSFDYKGEEERMSSAMVSAGLGNLLESIGNDYDIELSKKFSKDGVILSGGQNARVAIARSLYSDAGYYLLDEPSAALDPIAEAQILKQFSKSYSNRGLLMITHRLSNTETMDQIIVIENGKVVETGRHDELLAKKGRYFDLLKLQKV